MSDRANFDDFGVTENEAKKFIRLGIRGELEFEIMNNQTSQFQILNQRQLTEIYNNHPYKKEIRLTDCIYDPQINGFAFSYEQKANYETLWFDPIKFKSLLNKFHPPSENIVELTPEETLKGSPYWQELTKIAYKAIQKYPEWKKSQKKVQITANLNEWIKEFGINTREADVVKKILSDFYEELR